MLLGGRGAEVHRKVFAMRSEGEGGHSEKFLGTIGNRSKPSS